MADIKPSKPRGRRKLESTQSPKEAMEATRQDILRAATQEFVSNGYNGASISSITSRTKTSQRMLYYHFGGKKELYRAVLEAGYSRMFASAPKIESAQQDPLTALQDFAGQTFDRHLENEDFVRLIMVENIAGAKTVSCSEVALALGRDNLADLETTIQRGIKSQVFRSDLEAKDVYAIVAGLSFNAVSNRYTVQTLFGFDLHNTTDQADRRALIVEAACRYAAAR